MFGYLNQDFYVKIRTGFSSRDKRLFEINGVEIRESTVMTFWLYTGIRMLKLGKMHWQTGEMLMGPRGLRHSEFATFNRLVLTNTFGPQKS